ncbi:MAG: histidine kinase [Nocardioidaceae bacterium]
MTGLSAPLTAGELGWLLGGLVTSVPAVALGLLVSRRQPANAVGALLVLAGLAGVVMATFDGYLAAAASGALPVGDVLVSVTQGAWMLWYLPFAVLLLVFPDGRLLSPRWRLVAVALPCVAVVFSLLVSMLPGPYTAPVEDAAHVLGTSRVAGYAGLGLLPVFMGLLVASLAAVVVRYRSAGPRVRTQLRWLLLAGLTVPGTLLICWLSYLLLGTADLVVVGLVAMYVAIPAATAVAVLRRDLYDVDRALVAAASSGILATVLLGVFTVVSALAGLAVGRDSALVAVIATALCALALNPLRSRVARWLGRLLYPDRERALAAIDELRRRVHAGDDDPEQLEAVLRQALRDDGLRIGFLPPGADRVVDGEGAALEDGRARPIMLAGERIGMLVPGPDAEHPPPREVADASAVLVEMVGLRRELGRALREVEASRARLLRAGYDERHRLEQDLHDGAQQRLVALGMTLRVAQRHLPDVASDLHGVMDQAVAEITTAVAELRQIAHGLRPSSLDDGLAAALTNLTRLAPMPIGLEMSAGELPDDVSTTAYYVASEAVANAVKYAEAQRIDLQVAQVDGHVRVTVRDDGRGGAAVRPGAGLAGLSDRVGALGGRLHVTSGAGTGTVVEAVLPCGS